MWRILLGFCLLAWGSSLSAQAQQWTGTAGVGISGGHQTNAYLDPVLGSWDPLTDPTFMALTPHLGLTRTARRTRLDVTARSRLYPWRENFPQFGQGNLRLRYRLSPEWALEASAGGTHYRFASSRDSWWAFPSVRWTPTSTTTLALRGGLSQRYVATAQGTDRQPSGLMALSLSSWLTDRFRAEAQGYWSNGRTTTIDSEFGGTGVAVRGTYWPTSAWSIEVETSFDQLHYETLQTSSSQNGQNGRPGGVGGPQSATTGQTVQDHLGRIGLNTQWQIHPSISLFAHARALVARLADLDQPSSDLHVSGGLRLTTRQVLGGTAEAPPLRQVCHDTEEGVRVKIPYDGPGMPHLTGDFNNWTLPGIPMQPAEGGTWATTLDLPSGRHAYRIRVVRKSETSGETTSTEGSTWLDLPSYAQTADDAFGGTNGVCTVP